MLDTHIVHTITSTLRNNERLLTLALEAFSDVSGRYSAVLGTAELFDVLIDDMGESVALVTDADRQDQRILEIGGGLGLTHAYLRLAGYDIVSIEPQSSAHDRYHEIGRLLLQELQLETEGRWLDLRCEDLHRLDGTFDFIFSHYVLEHIPDLGPAFRAMQDKLRPAGSMAHKVPNYAIPFEPHFSIPLVPFWPRSTQGFLPKVRKTELWRSLNFVTPRMLRRCCAGSHLALRLRPGVFSAAVERMKRSVHFRTKHQILYNLLRALETVGLLHIMEKLPPSMMTPMVAELRHGEG